MTGTSILLEYFKSREDLTDFMTFTEDVDDLRNQKKMALFLDKNLLTSELNKNLEMVLRLPKNFHNENNIESFINVLNSLNFQILPFSIEYGDYETKEVVYKKNYFINFNYDGIDSFDKDDEGNFLYTIQYTLIIKEEYEQS